MHSIDWNTVMVIGLIAVGWVIFGILVIMMAASLPRR